MQNDTIRKEWKLKTERSVIEGKLYKKPLLPIILLCARYTVDNSRLQGIMFDDKHQQL